MIRYFVRRADDGEILNLVHIVSKPGRLWGEFWRGGQWIESGSVLDYPTNPDEGDEVSEAEAQEIIRALRPQEAAGGPERQDAVPQVARP